MDEPAELAQRLLELEARVQGLEQRLASTPAAEPLPEPLPGEVDRALLARLEGRGKPTYREGKVRGGVMYAGSFLSPNGDLAWHGERPAPLLLNASPEDLARVFAALGHAARISIVQHLLAHGPSERGTLQELIGTSSSGQLYHHLNTLIDANIIRLYKRGVYAVEAATTLRMLALLCAAYDVAEED